MNITILDGGMGQELLARSSKKPTGLWATQILLDAPDLVRAVHLDYFSAGADIATANTYAIHRDRLAPFGIEDRLEALQQQACQIAVSARDEHGSGKVAGSLGPIGWSYRPDLALPVDQAAERYAEIARLQEPYVDLLLCETMVSVIQARGAAAGASAVRKPLWLSVSVNDEDGTRLRSGEPVTDILPLIAEFNLAALLVNCSVPEAVSQAVPLLANHGVPVGGYANGFTGIPEDFKKKGATADRLEKRKNLGPTRYADFAGGWIKDGATIVGGCCEVGPDHIRELTRRWKTDPES
jgi:S-methylmethionine-dependent homocysteine/selenocysteine methylase